MKRKLEMPLEQFAEAVAKENERLMSGPGGIMEMKQTIADKEKRIAELENELAGRVVLTENYGQGSEPWLKDE